MTDATEMPSSAWLTACANAARIDALDYYRYAHTCLAVGAPISARAQLEWGLHQINELFEINQKLMAATDYQLNMHAAQLEYRSRSNPDLAWDNDRPYNHD